MMNGSTATPSYTTIHNRPEIAPVSMKPSSAFVPCTKSVIYALHMLERIGHFAREPDPRQLEHWISVNEARILSQAANRQHHLQAVSNAGFSVRYPSNSAKRVRGDPAK
jgi:hypothetical protein